MRGSVRRRRPVPVAIVVVVVVPAVRGSVPAVVAVVPVSAVPLEGSAAAVVPVARVPIEAVVVPVVPSTVVVPVIVPVVPSTVVVPVVVPVIPATVVVPVVVPVISATVLVPATVLNRRPAAGCSVEVGERVAAIGGAGVGGRGHGGRPAAGPRRLADPGFVDQRVLLLGRGVPRVRTLWDELHVGIQPAVFPPLAGQVDGLGRGDAPQGHHAPHAMATAGSV